MFVSHLTREAHPAVRHAKRRCPDLGRPAAKEGSAQEDRMALRTSSDLPSGRGVGIRSHRPQSRAGPLWTLRWEPAEGFRVTCASHSDT